MRIVTCNVLLLFTMSLFSLSDSYRQVEAAPRGRFILAIVPKHLKIDPLIISLVLQSAFLELSDDKTVDPDSAVKMLEHTTYYLKRLPPRKKRRLKSQFQALAKYARAKRWDPRLSKFLNQLLMSAGIF